MPRERLSQPRGVREWTLPAGAIARRETESPSSVEKLLGCPLKYVLDYAAGLHGFESPSLPDAEDSTLLGSLLHELLDRLFDQGIPAPDAVVATAERLFDAEVPRLAAPLEMPGAETQRARARRLFVLTAERMSQLLGRTGTTIVSSEHRYEGAAFGTDFAGTPDLVIGPPNRILDLKWGGVTYRSESLERGTAFQLAAYSYLTNQDGEFPGVAYFIMGAQRMFTTAPELFPGAEPIVGPSPRETWELYQREHALRWQEVEQGRIHALGVPAGEQKVPKKTTIEEGRLVVKPPCEFCEYAGMCGRTMPVEDE